MLASSSTALDVVSGVGTIQTAEPPQAVPSTGETAAVRHDMVSLALSQAFDSAARLELTTSPVTTTAGAAFSPQPVVRAVDSDGAIITAFTDTVTIAIDPGSGTSGALLGGTTTVTAVDGIADFAGKGLRVDRPGTGYRLLAVSGTLSGRSERFAITGSGNGNGAFGAPSTFSLNPYSRAAAVADLNGDSVLDLVVVPGYEGSLRVLFGNGDGSFQAPASYSLASTSQSVTLADFNGDGKLDAAAAIWGDGSSTIVQVLLGNGDGSFGSPNNFSVEQTPSSLSVGDFNDDGRLDLVTANYHPGSLNVLFGKGDGTFERATSFAAAPTSYDSHTRAVVIADLDGDGRQDLITPAAGLGTVLSNREPTTTTIASSLNPSIVGQAVTFTTTVLSVNGTGVPTGTVEISNGASLLGQTSVNATGYATLTTSALTAGTHAITAVYREAGGFDTSTSPVLTQTVTPVPLTSTTTALTVSVGSTVYGQTIVFTVSVTSTTSGAGTPTGTVTFRDGATALYTATLNGAATATFATTTLAAGTHTITAAYNGNTSYAPSTSASLTQVVSIAPTTTTISSTRNPAIVGDTVRFVVGVSSPTGVLAGLVTVKNQSGVLVTIWVSGGWGDFGNGSLGVATTSISVTTSVSSTASISVTAPVSGTVTFQVNGTPVATSMVWYGTAHFDTSALSVGVHSVVGIFTAHGQTVGIASQPLTQTVRSIGGGTPPPRVVTSTFLAASPNPATEGEGFSLSANVRPVPLDNDLPTGVVTFRPIHPYWDRARSSPGRRCSRRRSVNRAPMPFTPSTRATTASTRAGPTR